MATANNDCFSKNRVYQFKGPPTATFPDGQKLNWLMHSGTQELANDINMFRIAIGAEKLSIDGGSYGTAVVGVFATTFPQLVDKFVSNSPIDDHFDWLSYKFAKASTHSRYRASGQLGALLSSPVLDVRLLTALQVLQTGTPVPRSWGYIRCGNRPGHVRVCRPCRREVCIV